VNSAFVDTAYLIAIANRNDQWHAVARSAQDRLGRATRVTTDEVLVEFLAALSSGGPVLRRQAVATVRKMLAERSIRVFPQSRDSFLCGLERYDARRDKTYSLVDCVSMNVMEKEGIRQVLTPDRHFEQEGFRRLMQSSRNAADP
jgi:predicted nucleic acid-binding protein